MLLPGLTKLEPKYAGECGQQGVVACVVLHNYKFIQASFVPSKG